MTITFPPVRGVYTVNTTVAWPAEVDGEQITCEISTEALMDHFGATSMDRANLEAAFTNHRVTIENRARRLIRARAMGGRCLLVTADF
ncbi:DUF1488 domain-containing protein [Paraburkholderia silvatlantica]|uniref:DUF1488 domain-containing protein n=1 Tax=Paraburkholderia silvatlantica TaxID=321895 RepID=UPI0037539FDC